MNNDPTYATTYPPNAFAKSTGNPRIATSLHVTQSNNTFIIQTTLYGLDPSTIDVTVCGIHIIIEGTLMATSARGRYIRHVSQLDNGPQDIVKVTYEEDGQLVIEMKLEQSERVSEK